MTVPELNKQLREVERKISSLMDDVWNARKNAIALRQEIKRRQKETAK